MHAPAESSTGRPFAGHLALGGTLALALAILAVRLWSTVCEFPSMVWNDMRVATAVALARGWSVYPTGSEGVINTWTYGPLPLLYLWPASWAPGAAGALQVAAALNLALVLAPLALVCLALPAPGPSRGAWLGRIAAFSLCVAVWPQEFFALFYADSVAIACGLLGNLLLLRTHCPRSLWLAATLATAAVACKQTALGIPAAQVIWLGLASGWGAAGRHALRCLVAGALLGALAIASLGWTGLWFVLVELPANFKWFPEPLKRLSFVGPELLLYLGVPALVMMWQRRVFFSHAALRLAALAWAATIPLGIMALLKLGGRTNSLYSFPLWLPFVLTTLLIADHKPGVLQRWLPWGAAFAAIALACLRLLEAPRLALRPQLAPYLEAERFTRELRGRVWFPFHPLITLYSENRYYHDEDGLFVRQTTRWKISPEQAAAHLPPAMQVIAMRNGWNDWGVARKMMPPNAQSSAIGDWTLWYGTVDRPPPR